MKLKNKIAIITGGSQGIRKTIAIAMAREGAKVAMAVFLAPEDAGGMTGQAINVSGGREMR